MIFQWKTSSVICQYSNPTSSPPDIEEDRQRDDKKTGFGRILKLEYRQI